MNTEVEYQLTVVGVTVVGGLASFLFRQNISWIKHYLAINTGILVGITLFHFIPDLNLSGSLFQWALLIAGCAIPILISRIGSMSSHHHGLINTITLISFSLHSFFDGFITSTASHSHHDDLILLNVTLHRLPVAFSLFSIFSTHSHTPRQSWLLFAVFTMMTPIGGWVGHETFNWMTVGPEAILALTTGMFLYISVYHLLIEHGLFKPEYRSITLIGMLLPVVFLFI